MNSYLTLQRYHYTYCSQKTFSEAFTLKISENLLVTDSCLQLVEESQYDYCHDKLIVQKRANKTVCVK